MKTQTKDRLLVNTLITSAVFLGSLLASTTAMAQSAPPVPTPPYSVSLFAKAPTGVTQPDSIERWRDRILVGFSNGVKKDGSDGKYSTIVEYSLDGKVKRTFQVQGHNDGLRLVGEDDLWALQNEDGNPNLVIIELKSGNAKKYTFAPTVHGGGFDDMVVVKGKVYMTASNPTLDSSGNNVFPALVQASLSGSSVIVEPVMYGNSTATDIPTGSTVTLNLTDPDSMTKDPRGNIVFTSQADSLLVFVRHPQTPEQTIGQFLLSWPTAPPNTPQITIDDTAFATHPNAYLLVTDLSGNAIYRIDGGTFGFEPGVAYSASDTLGLVGTLNLDNGAITPVVIGFGSARGLLFVTPDRDREDCDDK